LQGSKGYLDGLKAAGLPVNDGSAPQYGTTVGEPRNPLDDAYDTYMRYGGRAGSGLLNAASGANVQTSPLNAWPRLLTSDERSIVFEHGGAPAQRGELADISMFGNNAGNISVDLSGLPPTSAESVSASRSLSRTPSSGTDEPRPYSIMRGTLGNSRNYGDYIVAIGADRPESLGGAIGRTDVLSSSDGLHQCVALLQAYGAGRTTTWVAGQRVTPGIDLPQNAMVASFTADSDGVLRYSGHAALFNRNAGGFDSSGLHVIDQYENGPFDPRIVHQRIIQNHPHDISSNPGNDAKDFYVVRAPIYR
jgi:hypothetical protein